jgi:hypothetical protein
MNERLRGHRAALLTSGLFAVAVGAMLHGALRGPPAPESPETDPTQRARAALWAHVESLGYAPDATEGAGFDESPGAPGMASALQGRRFIFVARSARNPHADVFLLHASIAPNGVPVALGAVLPLTETPDADETWLAVEGRRIAFTTRYAGRYTGVTVLELDADVPDPALGWKGALVRTVSNLLQWGRTAGVKSERLLLDRPTIDLRVDWDPTAPGVLVVSRPSPGTPGAWEEGRVAWGARGGTGVAWLLPVERPQAERSWLSWAVDTARGLSWIGPDRIYALERAFFSLSDAVQTLIARLSGTPTARPVPDLEPVPVEPALVTGGAAAPEPLEQPPVALAPRLHPEMTDEGRWRPVAFRPRAAGAPPTFWRTTWRADRDRPDAITELVYIDPRQVRLGVVGGTEHPRSTTGEVGTGAVPAHLRERTVAAFNGGFQAIHGGYGMAVDGRVLLPPLPQAATVQMFDDDRVGLGTWPAHPTESAFGTASLRQNLPPLIEDGRFNPQGAKLWGFALKGADPVYTWRSALARTRRGALLYGVCVRCSAEGLADALLEADAVYAMHLDMNISNIGFEWWRSTRSGPESLEHRALLPEMWRADEPRYTTPHPRDFFYLTERPWAPALAGPRAPRSPVEVPGLRGSGEWPPPVFTLAPAGDAEVPVALAFDADRFEVVPEGTSFDCALSLHRSVVGEGLPDSTAGDALAPGLARIEVSATPTAPTLRLRLRGPDAPYEAGPGHLFQQLPAPRPSTGRPRWLLGADADGWLFFAGGTPRVEEASALLERLGAAIVLDPAPVDGGPRLECGPRAVLDPAAPHHAHRLLLRRVSGTRRPWVGGLD